MTDEIWLKAYPKDIEWDQSFEVKPLWSILDDAVRRFPNNDIIDFLGKTYSYAEIGHQVDRAAAGHKSWPVFAQLPPVHYFLFWHIKSRRHGGELQPALFRAGIIAPNRGLAHRHHGDAEP